MGLIAEEMEGWHLNRINMGPPFHVGVVGRWELLQVCDAHGAVALSGPNGAVFCATREQADRLCELANAGTLDRI